MLQEQKTGVGEDVEKLDPGIAGGIVDGCSHMEDSLPVPQKVKHGITISLAIPLLGIYPKELKPGTQWILVCECSRRHYSQQAKGRNSLCPLTEG